MRLTGDRGAPSLGGRPTGRPPDVQTPRGIPPPDPRSHREGPRSVVRLLLHRAQHASARTVSGPLESPPAAAGVGANAGGARRRAGRARAAGRPARGGAERAGRRARARAGSQEEEWRGPVAGAVAGDAAGGRADRVAGRGRARRRRRAERGVEVRRDRLLPGAVPHVVGAGHHRRPERRRSRDAAPHAAHGPRRQLHRLALHQQPGRPLDRAQLPLRQRPGQGDRPDRLVQPRPIPATGGWSRTWGSTRRSSR